MNHGRGQYLHARIHVRADRPRLLQYRCTSTIHPRQVNSFCRSCHSAHVHYYLNLDDIGLYRANKSYLSDSSRSAMAAIVAAFNKEQSRLQLPVRSCRADAQRSHSSRSRKSWACFAKSPFPNDNSLNTVVVTDTTLDTERSLQTSFLLKVW